MKMQKVQTGSMYVYVMPIAWIKLADKSCMKVINCHIKESLNRAYKESVNTTKTLSTRQAESKRETKKADACLRIHLRCTVSSPSGERRGFYSYAQPRAAGVW